MKSIGNVAPSGTLIFIWNSNKALEINSVYISQNNVERKLQFSGITRSRTVVALLLICSQLEAAQPICIAFSNTDVSKSEVLISSNAIGVTGGNEGIITIPRFAGDWGVYRIVFFDKGLSVNAIVWFWVNSNAVKGYILNHIYETSNRGTISVDVSDILSSGYAIPFILFLADWSTGKVGMAVGTYRGKHTTQQPCIHSDPNKWVQSVSCDGKTLTITFAVTSYCRLLY